jgi:hypothetical protein
MNLPRVFQITLLVALVLFFLTLPRDSFMNYAQSVDPNAPSTTNPDATAANQNYASLLLYLQQHPEQSVKVIVDLKKKFFTDECKVRDKIDFSKLVQVEGGAPF